MRHRRPLLVFVAALVILGALAGKRALRPSANNHFVHLAQGWLEGRVSLPGKPPGWCARKDKRGQCIHEYDDYAKLRTLERADGSTFLGYPCKTQACAKRRRAEGVQRWYVVGQGWQAFARGQVRERREAQRWYITFPPGPAVLMLPFVVLFGLGTLDVLLTVIAGACIPAVLVAFLDAQRGREAAGWAHLWAGAAVCLASPLLWLAANGQVWFTAQVCCALLLLLALAAGWDGRAPVWAGLCLGLAVACRPTAALPAVLIFGSWWWRAGRPWGAGLRFAVPLALCGAILAAYNYVRFGDVLEFGHRFLEIRWQPRIQETGLFAVDYLGRNLRCLLTLLPVSDPKVPWRVSIHGTAVWVGAPWVFGLVRARTRFAGRGALWATIVLAAAPALLYQNSGQVQYSYRFAADWVPLLAVALALGGAFDARPGARIRNAWLPAAVLAGSLFQAWGAYYFERGRGKIFVREPAGWPFTDELKP